MLSAAALCSVNYAEPCTSARPPLGQQLFVLIASPGSPCPAAAAACRPLASGQQLPNPPHLAALTLSFNNETISCSQLHLWTGKKVLGLPPLSKKSRQPIPATAINLLLNKVMQSPGCPSLFVPHRFGCYRRLSGFLRCGRSPSLLPHSVCVAAYQQRHIQAASSVYPPPAGQPATYLIVPPLCYG